MPQPDGGFNEAADPVCGCQACKQANKGQKGRENKHFSDGSPVGAVASKQASG